MGRVDAPECGEHCADGWQRSADQDRATARAYSAGLRLDANERRLFETSRDFLMRNRGSIDALAVAICVASLIVAALAAWNLPPKIDSALYSQVRKTLAQQALAILPAGGRIVIIARDLQVY